MVASRQSGGLPAVQTQSCQHAARTVSQAMSKTSIIAAERDRASECRGTVGAEHIQTTQAEPLNVAAIEAGLHRKRPPVPRRLGCLQHALVVMTIRISQISHFLAEQRLQVLTCARELIVKLSISERRQVGMSAGVGVEAESLLAQLADVRRVHQGIGDAAGIVGFTPGVALADQLADQKYGRRPAEFRQHRRGVLMHTEKAVVE